ncbi:MAG: DinB family protein [Saprospiraceae bacterium]|nr:DinB family protein [Saprospiraceae bacterium]MDP4819772.1 DinB family protein [Saprospiraceae bacterium]
MKHRTQVFEKFDQADRHLMALLKEVEGYSDAVLDSKPAPGAWSVKENMYHLVKAEQLAHRYLEKKLSQPANLEPAGWKSTWRLWRLQLAFGAPFRIKAPAVVNPEDMPDLSIVALTTQWQEQRKALRDFLAAQPDLVFDKAAFNHPLVGRLSLWGMLDFFSGHLRRHQGQIRRTLAQVAKT